MIISIPDLTGNETVTRLNNIHITNCTSEGKIHTNNNIIY